MCYNKVEIEMLYIITSEGVETGWICLVTLPPLSETAVYTDRSSEAGYQAQYNFDIYVKV